MSPILVPTLAELGIELDRAYALTMSILARIETSPPLTTADPLEAEFNAACAQASDAALQIIELPAQSPADWRVKAQALCWFAHTSIMPPDPDPAMQPDEKIAHQMTRAILSGEIWQ